MREITNNFTNNRNKTYVINSGDHLYIKIYSADPKTSRFFQTDFPALMNPTYLYLNSYRVNEKGYINFSFVEKMYVKGLTIEEVRNLIQKTLDEYFKETTVLIKLVNFQVAVLGEVGSQGDYQVDREQINIFQAIGMAGGISEFGNKNKVTLVRQNLKGSEIHYLNLTDKKILESEYFYLMPNDIIYIEPLKSKRFLFSAFPYGLFFGSISFVISIIAIL